jgi:hypothetical protein
MVAFTVPVGCMIWMTAVFAGVRSSTAMSVPSGDHAACA